MRHPKDRSGVTRRQLLRGAAAAAAGTGVAGALVACQNTTTPIGFCEDTGTEAGGSGDGASAGGNGGTSSLVVAKPVGPGGLPLPRNDNSVQWAITDDNPMLADGVAPEGGTLRIYNYADYIDPGLIKKFGEEFDCEVATRDVRVRRRGDREAHVGRCPVRRPHRAQRQQHRAADGESSCCSRSTTPTSRISRRTSGPSCRTRSTTAARRTRCRTRLAGRHRLAQRRDRRRHRRDGGSLGHLLGVRPVARQGRRPRRQARHPQHAHAARRDAGRLRRRRQHRGPRSDRQGRRRISRQLDGLCNVKVTITYYQTLPEAKSLAAPHVVG